MLFVVAGFVAGALVAAGMVAGGRSLLMLFILPLALALPAYQAPKWLLKGLLDTRREQIVFEAPYVLNRLIVFLTLGGTVGNALLNIAGHTDRGGPAIDGYLVRELRQAAEDYQFWQSVEQALNAMIARNQDSAITQRIAERLLLHNRGTASIQALHVIADRAQTAVENLIQKRGNQNSTLMIVPTIVALIGIVGAIAGPAMYGLATFF